MTLPQRDSWVWSVLFVSGSFIVVTAGLIDNPADYGMSPTFFKWFKLVAAAVTIIGAKYGWSWATLNK